MNMISHIFEASRYPKNLVRNSTSGPNFNLSLVTISFPHLKVLAGGIIGDPKG